MENDLTKMLGIEYPIIQGGMFGISLAKLTAAVSNAGGLGTLGQTMDLDQWHGEIKKCKEMTDKPFAINLPMHVSELDKRLEIIFNEGVKVVVTAAGNPSRVMGPLKEAGITVLHLVASADQAAKVEKAGVDVVVAEGGESGGMVAKNRVATMVLIPAVVDAVKAPVVAAGGIGDARGMMAAFALGAQGVQLGTRFVAVPECETSDEHKDGICRAKDTDTHVVPRGSAQGRAIKDEVQPGAMAGQVSGIIHKVESVKDIIERMVKEADPILKKIESQVR